MRWLLLLSIMGCSTAGGISPNARMRGEDPTNPGTDPSSDPPQPGADGGATNPGAMNPGPMNPGEVCADVEISATRVTPNVVLIVDQSASMDDPFGTADRWNVLRDALMEPTTGLVPNLQSFVRFGLAMFSARNGEDNRLPVGMCPLVEQVDPALNNFDAINAVYGPAEPIGDTPTGDSVDYILDQFQNTPDPSTDPTIFILATDGEPDRCEELNPQNGQEESVAAIERAHQMGIDTFVISVGDGSVSEGHLQDVANAGRGVTAGQPDAPFWVAGDNQGLRVALEEIVGGALSCSVRLQGEIDPTQACQGQVELNGRPLNCDDTNGWRATDSQHIELMGESCQAFQTNPGVTLEASFPCSVILI